MRNTVLVGALILAGAVTLTGAFFLGRLSAPQAAKAPACDVRIPSSKADRNTVWAVLNREADALPDSPAKAVGNNVGMLLYPQASMPQRAQGFEQYLNKSASYFNRDEIAAIKSAIMQGTPQERMAAMKRVVIADGNAANLFRAVLADSERMNLFLSGQKVPLEP